MPTSSSTAEPPPEIAPRATDLDRPTLLFEHFRRERGEETFRDLFRARARSLAEAKDVARSTPHFERGETIELRPIVETPP